MPRRIKPFLSVVIPTHNDAEELPSALISLDHILSQKKYSSEILLVNHGSTDRTADIIKSMSRVIRNIKVIHNRESSGRGPALRQGMLVAQGNIRMFGEPRALNLFKLFDECISPIRDRGTEAVLCSFRPLGRGLKFWKVARELTLRRSGLLLHSMIRPRVYDTIWPAGFLTSKAAEHIFALLDAEDEAWDIEMLALAKKLGYTVEEASLGVGAEENGYLSARRRAPLQILKNALKVRWKIMHFGAYYSEKRTLEPLEIEQ